MPEYRLAQRGKAHVTGQRQFAAAAATAPGDLGDTDFGHGAQPVQRCINGAQRLLARLRFRWQGGDEIEVRVGHEKVGIRALQDQHPDRVVSFYLPAQPVDVQQHCHIHQVQLAIVQRGGGDALVDGDSEGIEIFVGHCLLQMMIALRAWGAARYLIPMADLVSRSSTESPQIREMRHSGVSG